MTADQRLTRRFLSGMRPGGGTLVKYGIRELGGLGEGGEGLDFEGREERRMREQRVNIEIGERESHCKGDLEITLSGLCFLVCLRACEL